VKALIDAGKASPGALLGHGHLAMTIDHGQDRNRYQGLVAVQGGSLEDAAHEYFRSSEQIPTRVKLAVAEEFAAGGKHHWRAGGILAQFLPKATHRAQTDLHPGDAPAGVIVPEAKEDDAWIEGRSLIETVEDLELIDPDLSSERLLYRLFHERGVRVFRDTSVAAKCSCSRSGVEAMLQSFSQDDRDHMVENGVISVTCEFCSANYRFAPEEVRAKPANGEDSAASTLS
jgi:molecular chaperone Hsp33